MINLRQVLNDQAEADLDALRQVQQIIREQFPAIKAEKIEKIPEELNNPLKYKYRTILIVAESLQRVVQGFVLLNYAPDLNFCFLDFIATSKAKTGIGIGGVLYERVRDECHYLGVIGLFFECLPDDPALCKDSKALKQNAARLAFYERYGVRPIINTLYETPLTPEDDSPPYLMFDDLGKHRVLGRDKTRTIVRAILERKYGDLCPRSYVDSVVQSINDQPVQLRPFRYRKESVPLITAGIPRDRKIKLFYNVQHDIHHIKQNGYVEAPVRIHAILRELTKQQLCLTVRSARFSDKYITAVHAPEFYHYLKRVSLSMPEIKSIYPYVFPVRNPHRPPHELAIRAGYYCMDTFTPLNRNAFLAARSAVDCALSAARELIQGSSPAYVLVRPPGHHAEKKLFGGFCYLNTTAIAAAYLSPYGKVAILDVDYHHGNGQQDIFYERSDVLAVSLHGHPNIAFPYFTGFKSERGYGPGLGYNWNYPLPETITPELYQEVLKEAVQKIIRFNPKFLVIAFGADTAKGDPTGSWPFTGHDFHHLGHQLGRLHYTSMVVQEGGYRIRTLGQNVAKFIQGLWEGYYKP